MKWLRKILKRRPRPDAPKCDHKLSKWVGPILEELGKYRSNGTLFLGLAEINNGKLKVVEDPIGFIRFLARTTRKSNHMVFEECVHCAAEGALIGNWRFFVVEEMYMGIRRRRLMASYVVYRSRYQPRQESSNSA